MPEAPDIAAFEGTVSLHSPLPPDHPFYALIGRVAAEWAQLEHVLDLIIWDLSGVDQKFGSCITGQLMGQYGRFNAIKTLAAARGFEKNTLNIIENISNTCSTLSKRRNRFVHDSWYTIGSSHVGQFKSFSIKDGKFGLNEVSDTYAEETITLIIAKVEEVNALMASLANWRCRSSIKIQRQQRRAFHYLPVR